MTVLLQTRYDGLNFTVRGAGNVSPASQNQPVTEQQLIADNQNRMVQKQIFQGAEKVNMFAWPETQY
ncbi:hypothetical protein SP565_004836 [Salmonella enterica]|nr:hypothetical protein [Salmonella enterica]